MKRVQRWQKYWKLFLWLGPCLIIVGLFAAFVSGSWGPLPVGILLAGVVLLGLWLLFQGQLVEEGQAARWWGKRSTQVGTNAAIATLAVIVLLGLINFLGVRYSARVDLTENQQFTLAPQSQQVVTALEDPVKVWIFDRQPQPLDQELLKNYQRYGKNLTFEYVDPDRRSGLARDFGIQSVGDVYLEAGERRQFLQNIQNERLSESKLTTSLEQITSGEQSKVYFLQGHGERPLNAPEASLSQAVQALEDKNFVSAPLDLVKQGKVPDDASVVVITSPQQALFEGELKALQDFLKSGGGLLVMIDPNTDPGLNDLLKQWGILLDDRIAINNSTQQVVGLGPGAVLVSEYGDHPITQEFESKYSFYPLARPLQIEDVLGVEATPLLITDNSTWAVENTGEAEVQLDPETDQRGPLTLGVAASRSQPDAAAKPEASPSPSPEETASPNDEAASPEASPEETPEANAEEATEEEAKADQPPEARLVVIGNSSFTLDGFFNQQLNGDVFLNAISWLGQREDDALSIRPKEPTDRRIVMNPQQSRLLGLMALIVVPLIGFGTAIAAWWRRR